MASFDPPVDIDEHIRCDLVSRRIEHVPRKLLVQLHVSGTHTGLATKVVYAHEWIDKSTLSIRVRTASKPLLA
jgi:hypothetical protein